MTAQILPNKPRMRSTWSAEERAQWVELFEKSGQTALEFCREHDLTPTTLAFWRSSQRKDPFAGLTPVANPVPGPAAADNTDPEEEAEEAFVEVPLTALNAGSAPACAAAVTVRLTSGMQLEIVSGTDPCWLSELLDSLQRR